MTWCLNVVVVWHALLIFWFGQALYSRSEGSIALDA